MSSITIHMHPFSQPSRTIILLAHHFKCYDKIEWKVVDLTTRAHLTEEFLKINPYHSVPVCVISSPEKEDIILYESPAILQYLAEYFHWEGDYGFPTTHNEKWAVINALHKHHNIIRANSTKVLRSWGQTFFTKGKVPFDREGMLKGLEAAQNEWKILDTVLEKNNGTLTGKFSIADVLAFSELYQFVKADERGLSFSIYDFDQHPNIKKWLSTMAAVFVNEDVECWQVVQKIITISKTMMPSISILEEDKECKL